MLILFSLDNRSSPVCDIELENAETNFYLLNNTSHIIEKSYVSCEVNIFPHLFFSK